MFDIVDLMNGPQLPGAIIQYIPKEEDREKIRDMASKVKDVRVVTPGTDDGVNDDYAVWINENFLKAAPRIIVLLSQVVHLYGHEVCLHLWRNTLMKHDGFKDHLHREAAEEVFIYLVMEQMSPICASCMRQIVRHHIDDEVMQKLFSQMPSFKELLTKDVPIEEDIVGFTSVMQKAFELVG